MLSSLARYYDPGNTQATLLASVRSYDDINMGPSVMARCGRDNCPDHVGGAVIEPRLLSGLVDREDREDREDRRTRKRPVKTPVLLRKRHRPQ